MRLMLLLTERSDSRTDPAHAPVWWPFEGRPFRAGLLLVLGLVLVRIGIRSSPLRDR